jgi:RHS repeat-associated protein
MHFSRRTTIPFVVFIFLMLVTSLPAFAAAPTITGLSVSSGTTGTAVTISGTNFGSTQGSSTVKFGDWLGNVSAVTATVNSWSNTAIVAVVPTFLTGASYFEVVVGGSGSNKEEFAVTNPYTYSLVPSTGTAGTVVTIWGTNFGSTQGSSTLTFGGTTAEPTSWSSNSIVVPVPNGVANGNITVQLTVGGLAANTQTFTVSSNAFISYLSTNSAPVDEEVTITGVNFGTSQGSSTVTFNGVSATPIEWTNTAISTTVPAGATTGNVVVTVGGTSSNAVAFMVTPPAREGGVGFIQGSYSTVVGTMVDQGNGPCQQLADGLMQTTIQVPFPVEQTAGDLNVVIAGWRDTYADLAVSGDEYQSYYQVGQQTQSGNGQQWTWFATNIYGGENTVLVVLTSSHGCVSSPEVRVAEYRGLSTASEFGPLDVSASANSTGSATCNSGSATTTNENDVLIGVSLAAQSTTAAGTNYTGRVITPSGDILEDEIVTATGSHSATATMAKSGDCVMQLFAFKEATNEAPVVSAGPNLTITLPTNSVTLNGSATDDGLPNNTLTISWTQVSGPGTATFSSPSTAVTQATFPVAGTYVLQLSADDSELTSTSQVTVTVYPPLQVTVGSNQTITLPVNFVSLTGSASGGGLPITTTWSTVSGPSPAFFASVSSPNTTAAFSAAGVYTLALTATNGEATVSANTTITVNPASNTPPGASIVLTPASAGPILTGTAQQLQATVTNNTGGAIANTSVTFTVTGPNGTSGAATTNSSGVATFSYTGTKIGVDAVVATATVGELPLTSNTSMISWVAQSPVTTLSTVQGEFFTSNGSGIFNTPSNAQSVFTQTFASINFNPPAGSIPGMPSTIGVTTVPFTDVTVNSSGQYTGSVIAQGNGQQAGVGELSTFQAVFTGTITVASAGQVTFYFENSDGFIFGVGSGASRVSGTYIGPPSSTPFNNYPVMGAFNAVTSPVANTITVNFPNAGTYPYEVDYADSNQATLIPPGDTWQYMIANATLGTINSISRSSNVVTITINQALANFAAGATVSIAGVSDLTDFPNSTQTVTSVIADVQGSGNSEPYTEFTVNWSGNNASSSGGTVIEDFNQPFYLIGYDDSNFSIGQAPFTNVVGGFGCCDCPIVGKTLFPTFGIMDLRQTVTLPAGASDVQALVAIDNDFTLWVNGTEVINQDNEGCSQYWNYTVPIPSNLLQAGTNLIAVQARDRGLDTGFDLSLTGPASLIPAKPLTLIMSIDSNNGQDSVTLAPSVNQSPILGTPVTFTALVTNSSGGPLSNVPVIFNVAGVNTQQATVLSGTAGTATFTYDGFFPGLDIVQASANVANTVLVSGQTQVNWAYQTNLPQNGTLVLSPSNPQTQTIGQSQSFTVEALNGSGQPVPNVSVTLLVSVTNTQWLTATTNSSGIASFSYSGTIAGTDTVEANAVINGIAAFSNLTTVTWNPPSGSGTTYVFTPQGWIASPSIGAVVQNQTNIMLESGITLTSGTLKYFPSSNTSNVTVLNSNTTGTGPLSLGVFDPTLLANGQYTIQLQAISSTGAALLSETVVSVTGTNKPGREVVTVTDFKVPLAGIPVNISRTFDSLNRGTVEDFGYGWALGTTVNLQVDLLMNVTFTLNGNPETFYFTPQSAGLALFPWLLEPAYTPQPGFHGTLTSNGCGILIYSGGQIVQDASGIACFPGGNYQPTVYTYTDPSGRAYTMSSSGQLQTIKDLNGNTLTFTPTGITSSVGGVVIPFVRDSQNRITQITDLNGNNYTYTYDGNGNLETVQYPGLSTTGNYTYATDHSLLTQTDPVGNTTIATYYSNGRLETFTDAMNDEWQYSYNVLTNTTTTTDPDNGVVVQTNDNFGNPLAITDPLGRTTTYTYDAHENKISQTDALGNTTTYTYDSYGNQTSVTDPLQHTSTKTYNQYAEVVTATDAANTNTQTLTYNANFNLTQITDLLNGPGTQLYAATYDSLGDVLTTTDANGNTTENTYDTKGNILQTSDPLNEVTHHTYDAMDRILSTTDPRGNTTQYTYDDLGNLKTKTDALNDITSYTYDANSNQLSMTDANNNTTNYQYDKLNRLIKTTYPDGTTTQTTYDFRRHPLTQTDQLGRVTEYVYDLAGELLTVTYAYGTADTGTVTYTYDTDGRQKTIKDEVGNTTTQNYDNASRLTSIQDPLNDVTNYGYDADNRETSVTDPNQHTTSYTYDARGRLAKITYNDNTTTQYSYDGDGHVLTTTDQAGQVTTDAYDAVGRLLSVKDALGKLTQYTYDADGDLVFLTDADGRVSSYQYDVLDRVSLHMLPLGQAEYKSYDPVSNLIGKTDFNGNTTSYTYDKLNRLLTKVPASSLNEPTITFTYTATGKRASMIDASGTTNYTYNNRDHTLTEATPEGTLSYTYDAHENLLTIASSNTNGASATYTYDPLNRLASVKDNRIAAEGGPSNPTTYSYDPAGNLIGYAYSNSVQTGNVYDTLNRLTQTCQASSSPACSASTKLGSYTYTLGAAGNRTNVLELNGRNVAYGYDNDYHLMSETITSDPASNNGAETYTYDAVGNRLTLNSTIPSLPGAISYSYDANDRLSTDSYDNDGNTIASGGISDTYDFENHMLTHGGVSMTYDGDGNRVSEAVGTTTTKYLVDNLNPTGYSQIMDELVSGSVTRTYAYGLQRISENQLVSSTWTPSFYGYDGHGNVRFLTNTSGTPGNTYTFDAFGAQIATAGTTANTYEYSGERFDSNLNLYYLRARYYNMLTGRFETMDPGRQGSCCGSCSLYASNAYVYASDNSVNRIDPTGRDDVAEAATLYRYVLVYTAATILYYASRLTDWEICYLKLDNPREGGSGFHNCWYQCVPSGRVIKSVQFGWCPPFISSF